LGQIVTAAQIHGHEGRSPGSVVARALLNALPPAPLPGWSALLLEHGAQGAAADLPDYADLRIMPIPA
jgi:hypothetical protein